MSGEETSELDRLFKALGHSTRRRILQLLAQNPRYAYELSKTLELNRRVVLKHLEALEQAGLIDREPGTSDLGPDRTYYRLNVSFGLSTTILPNAFVVGLTRRSGAVEKSTERGALVSGADVEAVRLLLNTLEGVNTRLEELEEQRMRLAAKRGRIVARIEQIMQECAWGQKSCERVRSLIDPVEAQDFGSAEGLVTADTAIQQALSLFERLMGSPRAHDEDEEEDDDDVEIEVR